ncbi:MAG: glycosyltransferase family 2 protein [Bacteroidota bacterium]
MAAIQLSVVIITYNEQRNIGRCIDSIQRVADEIIVVDSFSQDDTVMIANQKGAKVISHGFEGHIEQKNFAVTQASFPYILSLDADELPDETFLTQIKQIKQNWQHDGYSVNRLNNYCGKWIRHGAWYPDVKLRLWDSRKGKWAGTNPHDRYEMNAGCSVVHLPGNLLHYSYQTVDEHKKKSDYFSSIAANAYFTKGKKSSTFKIVFSPLFRFVRDYVIKCGFLDGKYGWIIASITAKEVALKYKKLHTLQRARV